MVGPDSFGAGSSENHQPLVTRFARAMARLRSDWTFAVIDTTTVVVSYAAALALRSLDAPTVVHSYRTGFMILLPVIVFTHLLTNSVFGVYGHEWEHASVEEAMRLLAASGAAGAAVFVGLVTFQEFGGAVTRLIPIGVVAMGTALAFGGMGAVRFRARMFSFHRTAGMVELDATLVIGTSHVAAEIARTGTRRQQPIRVVGFVSAVPGPSLMRIAGLPVLGSLADVPMIVDALNVEQILIAEPLHPTELRDLVDVLLEVDVRLRIVPQLEDVLNTDSRLQDVRDVSVADLLPRPVVDTDLGPVSELLAGKRILITGAGGSIGVEITRQVLQFAPEAVFAVDHDETHLHDGSFVWQSSSSGLTIVLCDVRDVDRLETVFAEARPDVVFHAAAHKHVPILEQYPGEAVKTNIVGTANVLDACRDHGVERFVLVSTDKAVEPTSAMGASKRVAEMLTQSAAERRSGGCTYAAVRFGNVLGSRGSVVPTFMRQIEGGGPVTVTDPEMLRYFMTVDESVQLVLQVSALAEGGEVFVLDMGEPVRIGDLAHRMIRLSGLVPGRDIEVKVTGTRPGEKYCEILSLEPLEASPLPRINIARPGHPGGVTLLGMVEQLRVLADHGTTEELREFLLAVSNQPWRSDEVVNLAPLEAEIVAETG